MTTNAGFLQAALDGFAIQRRQIEASEAEVRKELAQVLAEVAVPKRQLSATGRANISWAAKRRWAKWRKEHAK